MKEYFLQIVKFLITKIGELLPDKIVYRLQTVIYYFRLAKWMKRNNFITKRRLINREKVFDSVIQKIYDKKVLYLEFGVYKGDSIKYWSKALKNPESNLHGFDSFEGLPEDFEFDGIFKKGTFDLKGEIPKVDDNRVKFFKGWFNETLPNYTLPSYEVLVINMDADLYSSTKYVLNFLQPYIIEGTYIYFDDLARPDHEPKAFEEFMKETGLKFKVIAVDYSLNNAFFECIGR